MRYAIESLGFAEMEFESLEDYLKWQIDNFPPCSNTKSPIDGLVFRGHALADRFELNPVALRGKDSEGYPSILKHHPTPCNNWSTATIGNVVEAEYNALLEFFRESNLQGLLVPHTSALEEQYLKKYHDSYFSSLPKWYDSSTRDLAALAQHHGVPTRMLDWTFNINVAFFFALEEIIKRMCDHAEETNLDERYAIWGVNASYIATYYDEYTRSHCPFRFFVPSYASDPNVRSQVGLLTYYEISDYQREKDKIYVEKTFDKLLLDYLEGLGRSQVNIANDGLMLCKMTFPTENAVSEFEYICSQGTNAAKIFPGYEGVVKKIKEDEMLRRAKQVNIDELVKKGQ